MNANFHQPCSREIISVRPKHTQSTIKGGQMHRAGLSSVLIAESRWFHREVDSAETVKWDSRLRKTE